jgi:hypothetical protein
LSAHHQHDGRQGLTGINDICFSVKFFRNLPMPQRFYFKHLLALSGALPMPGVRRLSINYFQGASHEKVDSASGLRFCSWRM